jgi:hypothetical protein
MSSLRRLAARVPAPSISSSSFFFLFFAFGGVAIFDHLDVYFSIASGFIILGFFPSLGCRRITP